MSQPAEPTDATEPTAPADATVPPAPTSRIDPILETANDRLKRSFGSWLWGSMIAATAIHFGVLAFWPNLEAADFEFSMDEIEAIELPPEIEIPPPPEQIARPANPVVTTAEIDADVTIAPTSFEANPQEDLPPPPSDTEVDISTAPTFTPHTVAPEIVNRAEFGRALEREYPAILRDNGIGGTVRMHFFIDENGNVENFLVSVGSPHEQLDEAALRVAEIVEFTPALNRDERVPVWIELPITFQAD